MNNFITSLCELFVRVRLSMCILVISLLFCNKNNRPNLTWHNVGKIKIKVFKYTNTTSLAHSQVMVIIKLLARFVCILNLDHTISVTFSPDVGESKKFLDSGFHAVDSGFQVQNYRSFSLELVFRIPHAKISRPSEKYILSLHHQEAYRLLVLSREENYTLTKSTR